jgi:hypothetical protein
MPLLFKGLPAAGVGFTRLRELHASTMTGRMSGGREKERFLPL